MPLQEKLTRRQKELIRELYYSWPAGSDKVRLIEVSMEQLWQPYYNTVNKVLGTDTEQLVID